MRKLGTRWVKPGGGAQTFELLHASGSACEELSFAALGRRTDLALTGESLKPLDLWRIAIATGQKS